MTFEQIKNLKSNCNDLVSYLSEKKEEAKEKLHDIVHDAVYETLDQMELFEIADHFGLIAKSDFGLMENVSDLLDYYSLAQLLSSVSSFYDNDTFYHYTSYGDLDSTDDITSYIEYDDIVEELESDFILGYTSQLDYFNINDKQTIDVILDEIKGIEEITSAVRRAYDLIDTEEADDFNVDEELDAEDLEDLIK